MKTCIKCNLEKDENSFCKNKNKCKECYRLYHIEYSKNYHKIHKYESSIFNKEYRKNHKNELSKANKEYRKINKIRLSKYKNEYLKNKRKNNSIYKLKINASTGVYKGLKKNNSSKNRTSVWNYLDYTPEGLKLHLEAQFNDLGNEWMNWNNYGLYDPNKKTWNIDHIIPHSTFKYSSMEDNDFKKCWELNNLRPLEAKQNILDGATRIRHV